MGATMAVAGGAQGAVGLVGSFAQADAIRSQSDYQKKMYDLNSQMAGIQADDSINRGEKSAAVNNAKTKLVIGSQRANLAAQGIDVNSGSAVDVQSSTAGIGALDTLTIRNNAWREAWGYKVQANQYSNQGRMVQDAGNFQANSTMLTGGMQFLGSAAKAGYQYGQG